jgi:hypothetical protein
MKLRLLPKLVEKIVWIAVISFCKIFIPSYAFDNLFWLFSPPNHMMLWVTLLDQRFSWCLDSYHMLDLRFPLWLLFLSIIQDNQDLYSCIHSNLRYPSLVFKGTKIIYFETKSFEKLCYFHKKVTPKQKLFVEDKALRTAQAYCVITMRSQMFPTIWYHILMIVQVLELEF